MRQLDLSLIPGRVKAPAPVYAGSDMPLRFYLGVHRPGWLAEAPCRLFVARQAFGAMARLPRARGPWALDSGGFTELNKHGLWTRTPREYCDDVRRLRDEVGQLEWAAPMDWMCARLHALRAPDGPPHDEGQDETLLRLHGLPRVQRNEERMIYRWPKPERVKCHEHLKHPMQPVYLDENGTARFKENAIVEWAIATGKIDLNEVACLDFSDADREHFDQLHGYSVHGAPHLSDAALAKAELEIERIKASR